MDGASPRISKMAEIPRLLTEGNSDAETHLWMRATHTSRNGGFSEDTF
jgi:hypothetical protein